MTIRCKPSEANSVVRWSRLVRQTIGVSVSLVRQGGEKPSEACE
jgi:hypothetical protein